jgi:hypothetical protein
MTKLLTVFLLPIILLHLFGQRAMADDLMEINATKTTPLFDGRCKNIEWSAATKIKLPSENSIYLMHDKDSLYICAKGKVDDYAVIDILIEDVKTGHLHKLHASAQLGERIYNGKNWSEPDRWNLKDWSGFWVPYAGRVESEDGLRPKFLKGSHREMQILRKKFSGDIWNMMIIVSGISFPDKAIDTDKSTWHTFSFSEQSSL